MKKCLIVLSLSAVALLSGCVVGQRTISLQIPTSPAAAADKGALCIASVIDNRVFENNPKEASTPSIDGDVTSMTPDQKAVMIGRQRNGFGKAMGDIAMAKGETVTERSKILVAEALKQRGYKITDDTGAPSTATVSVGEFWAWFSPGMWAVTFESKVSCTITLKKPGTDATVTIKGYGINKGQAASNENWQLAYDRAFQDFLAKFAKELDATSF